MNTDTHELIAAYALDALDDEERAQVEVLLATSPEAREELRTFTDAAAALAVAATGPTPSVELRERIVADARAERQTVVPLDTARPRSWRVPALAAAAGLAAAVAIGVGLWATALRSDLDEARSALDAERTVTAILADPAAREVALASGDGRLVVAQSGEAVLVADGLGPAPSGRTYQLWIVQDGAATSAGLFDGRSDPDAVPVEGNVDEGTVVAVTVEAVGGAAQPTGAPILASQPV